MGTCGLARDASDAFWRASSRSGIAGLALPHSTGGGRDVAVLPGDSSCTAAVRCLSASHQPAVWFVGAALGIVVRRLGEKCGACSAWGNYCWVGSVRGTARQPAALVVLLLAGYDPVCSIRHFHSAGVDRSALQD